MLEQSLSEQMRGDSQSDHTGQNLRRALRGRLLTEESHVRDLGADLGISERTISRRCQELFGFGPKTFARILRFQRFIAGVGRTDRPPLSMLASLCGYADQAHLSREVRRLSGLTPADVVARFANAG